MAVSITYSIPRTGYSPPDTQEAGRLLKIVDAGAPWLKLAANVEVDEFRRAMAASGLMFRASEPVTKYAFGHFVDAANELVMTHGRGGSIGGVAFLGSVLAHADVCWRRADGSVGQMLEVGLDVYAGRGCQNAWRGLLTGERNIMAPMPPRSEFVHRAAKGVPQATFWTQGENGMRQIERGDPLWSRSRS
jgi:hypothetical protein